MPKARKKKEQPLGPVATRFSEYLDTGLHEFDKCFQDFAPYYVQHPDLGKGLLFSQSPVDKDSDQALKDSFTGLPVAKTFDDYKILAKLDPEQVYKQGYKNNADVYRFRTVDFDPKKFADNLGLNDVDGRAALEVALEGTGTKIKDIERFLDIAEKSADSFFIKAVS